MVELALLRVSSAARSVPTWRRGGDGPCGGNDHGRLHETYSLITTNTSLRVFVVCLVRLQTVVIYVYFNIMICLDIITSINKYA